MKKIQMGKIADKIIDINLQMKEGEKIAIITEPEKLKLAETIPSNSTLSIMSSIIV